MHWAIVGQTAAEIIHSRADAGKPNMGLTSWTGGAPRKGDTSIAKNYLNTEELRALNLIVSAYLDFAEFQAVTRKPMSMADWIVKLDDFIRISDREILTHAGKISHDTAKLKAETEYVRFLAALPQPVDQHFISAINELKQIEAATKKPSRSKPQKERR